MSQGWYAAYAQAAAAELAVIASLPDAEQHLAAATPAAQQNAWASACLARTAGRVRNDPSALASAVKTWERIGARYERACTLLLLPCRANEGHAELNRSARPGTRRVPSWLSAAFGGAGFAPWRAGSHRQNRHRAAPAWCRPEPYLRRLALDADISAALKPGPAAPNASPEPA